MCQMKLKAEMFVLLYSNLSLFSIVSNSKLVHLLFYFLGKWKPITQTKWVPLLWVNSNSMPEKTWGLKLKFPVIDQISWRSEKQTNQFCRIVHFILKIENFSRVNQMKWNPTNSCYIAFDLVKSERKKFCVCLGKW